ncbi:MAG: diguanylate cyclase domain-containing protein [Halarsenatibacteraceae bacterium]
MQNNNFYHNKALNNISELVFYLDADLNIKWANQAVEKYFDKDFKNIEDYKCFKKWDKQNRCKSCPVIKAQETKEIEEGIMEKHNNRIWKIKAIPELNKEGEIEGIIEIVKDITPVNNLENEQTKYEDIYNAQEYNSIITEAIQQKKLLEMNKFFVDNADLLIFRVSPEGMIEYANQTAIDKLDYIEEEVIGLSVSDFIPNQEFVPRAEFWQRIKDKGSLTYERSFVTKKGDSFPVEITSQYFKYDGKDYEFVFIKDISEMKRYERIIRELNKVAIEFHKLDNEKEICQKTIIAAKKILNFELCGIALVDDNKFVPAATSDQVEFESLPKDHGIMGKAFKNNQSYLNSDIEEEPDAKPIKSTYKSGMAIPLQDIGVFQAVSNNKNAFSQKDLEFAEILIASTKAALERVYHQEKLKYKSFHDSLTELYNRNFFEKEIQRLDTNRQLPLSIIMADVNGLKIINDSFGHNKGDEILLKTAETLKSALREEDILARQGGDEFAVLLPDTNDEQVNKIIKRIKKTVILENEDRDIPISIAIGTATKENSDQNINDILQEADDNMYQNKLSDDRSSKSNIVHGLLNTLSAKSYETKEHAIRMTKLAFNFGENLNLSNSELNKLSLLASMHDIGKTSIPEEILTKPGDLNDQEWEMIKKHSEQGYKIASASEEFSPIAEAILAHHERWNGNGYPGSLKGEEIPYLARIISIIDAYDVMTNDRPYSKAISIEKALAEIKACAGSQFDPELAEKFVELVSLNNNI